METSRSTQQQSSTHSGTGGGSHCTCKYDGTGAGQNRGTAGLTDCTQALPAGTAQQESTKSSQTSVRAPTARTYCLDSGTHIHDGQRNGTHRRPRARSSGTLHRERTDKHLREPANKHLKKQPHQQRSRTSQHTTGSVEDALFHFL
ncbi:hypothetical protein HPB50_006746 [Hyalomma asiaticum]|uniref:Uncharacterized protein n=1 Tax=Hyalomma asiaticum TaxID=266040 RepID=A0ACB7SKP2_HYAAI|nr:hypothetical protein HPB50_006746 [Hyalomma asiaticum]